MYEQLYRYFIQYKKLAVPGVGTFLLERKPAEPDFVNKQIIPPSYSVNFRASAETPPVTFFKWLGDALHISDRDAIIRFNDFIFELKKQITDGSRIDWNGVGVLSIGHSGEMIFDPAPGLALEDPLPAEKVIREKADHMVRVGEDQRSSAEMTEMLNQPTIRRSRWWLAALIIGLPALLFTGWYFYEHGMDVTATANHSKLVPMETTVPYQLLQ